MEVKSADKYGKHPSVIVLPILDKNPRRSPEWEEMVRQQNIQQRFKLMQRFRNDLRTTLEKSAILSGLLDRDDIPEMSAQDIYDEEINFRTRMLMRIEAEDEKSRIKQEQHYLQATHALQKTPEMIERDQRARYLGTKMAGLLKEGKCLEAKDFYDSHFQKFTNELDVEALKDVCTLYVIDAVMISFQKGNYSRMIAIIMEFAYMVDFKRSDFEFIMQEALKNPKNIDAIAGKISAYISARPQNARAILDYFVLLGFLKDDGSSTPQPMRERTESGYDGFGGDFDDPA